MQDKNKNPQKDPLAVSSDPALESRVDAMMSLTPEKTAPELTAETPSAPTPEPVTAPKPGRRIDIFHDTKTAPEVPTTLAKEVTITDDEPAIEAENELVAESELPTPEPIVNEPILLDSQPETTALPKTVGEAYDDAETDRAIDDITRSEADKALLHDDIIQGVIPAASPHIANTKKSKRKTGGFWHQKWVRVLLLVLVLALIGGAAGWPRSRYFLLNSAGVRSSVSMKITDGATGLPLKNAKVRLGSMEQTSNGDGMVQFKEVRLGAHELSIDRVAFAPIKRMIVIGWGSNPLGDQELKATGAQYVFDVRDFLSDKPVPLAEATSQDAGAVIDEKGIITLAVEDPSGDSLEVKISAPGYRQESLTIPADSKDTIKVRMVPSKPVVFITKESGKYDLYKIDVDGKNKQLLLADIGGGSSKLDAFSGRGSVLVSDDGKQAAVISKHSSTQKSADGELLDSVTVIDLATAQAQNLDYAEQVRLLAWNGDKLVYSAIYAANVDGAAKGLQRIVSYDLDERARTMLVTTDSFSGIIRVRDFVYYTYVQADGGGGFARIKLDGKEPKQLLENEAWALRRSGGSSLDIQTVEGAKRYNLANGSLQDFDGNDAGRVYLDGPNETSLWVDERDGSNMLLSYDLKTGQDTLVTKLAGMVAPIQWLNQHTVVVSVQAPSETSLFAINTSGGEPVRVTSATLTALPNTAF